jgi:hypothetical protein
LADVSAATCRNRRLNVVTYCAGLRGDHRDRPIFTGELTQEYDAFSTDFDWSGNIGSRVQRVERASAHGHSYHNLYTDNDGNCDACPTN